MLASAIRELGTFTYEQIRDELKKRTEGGPTCGMDIGGGWSIKDYLSFWEELGLLEENFGRYKYIKKSG